MPEPGDHSSEPPSGAEDRYERVRSLLTECVYLLGAGNGPLAPTAAPAPGPDLNGFEPRELVFLRHVRHPEGWPYRYIAVLMDIKLCTLHYMRAKLFAKLNVPCRTALALKVRDWPLG